jgi:hypothetical protein
VRVCRPACLQLFLNLLTSSCFTSASPEPNSTFIEVYNMVCNGSHGISIGSVRRSESLSSRASPFRTRRSSQLLRSLIARPICWSYRHRLGRLRTWPLPLARDLIPSVQLSRLLSFVLFLLRSTTSACRTLRTVPGTFPCPVSYASDRLTDWVACSSFPTGSKVGSCFSYSSLFSRLRLGS